MAGAAFLVLLVAFYIAMLGLIFAGCGPEGRLGSKLPPTTSTTLEERGA